MTGTNLRPGTENLHPSGMNVNDSATTFYTGRLRRVGRYLFSSSILVLLIASLFVPVPAQVEGKTAAKRPAIASASVGQPLSRHTSFPLYQGSPKNLAQDQGTAGLRLALRRLGTTARLMQTTAHPDDEDGGMLTLEARGRGVSTLLMTLNRGEGGQNKIGSNLSDVLGVLRALELLASDQYYGVQERFSHVADFGFSKNPEETFQKWGGHEPALEDMVRVIRTFRPDVLVARFSGTDRDGHGHHQASAMLTKEAFHAAADPQRFPLQIAAGLLPWQARKLYIGNVCGFGASACPDADYTLKLNTGQVSPALGMSSIQFAMQGLRHQQSQGAATWNVEPGDRFTFYRLVDSASTQAAGKNGHEADFFEGIDTTLPGLTSRLAAEQSKLPGLRKELEAIAAKISEATKDADGSDASAASGPLFEVVAALDHVNSEVSRSSLGAPAKLYLATRLWEKQEQAEQALNFALNLELTASAAASEGATGQTPRESDALTTVSPGEKFLVAVKLRNGSKNPLTIESVQLEVPEGWSTAAYDHKQVSEKPGEEFRAVFRLQTPKKAAYTRPYWHRADPDRESVNHVDDARYATLPFPPAPLHAVVEYSTSSPRKTGTARGQISAVVSASFLDDKNAERTRPLAIVPSFSVMLEPATQVISTRSGSDTRVRVGVTSNVADASRGTLRLELPQGWRSEPAERAVRFGRRGEKQDFEFQVFPTALQEGRTAIRAVLTCDGEEYREGYTLVTREDLGSFYYYQPAQQRVSIVDVQTPRQLKVGYVMGAGDDIATVLQQVGLDVTLIPAEKLTSANLSAYHTIILGIRAYDTQKDVVANNKKLLDWVSGGGTLVVQYNASVSDFNSGHFTPYPAQLSRARVSIEEAPVQILAPDDPIFHYPNTITSRDFDGWVQERGLYFMDQWDEQFHPLLACNDPGEAAQKGGLLRAQYGKGVYIYSAYAFFRQLPAGVPGAVRLFVNLLSAGQEKGR
jgi:LmbE family N-acetylglucosaminyl deacetylase